MHAFEKSRQVGNLNAAEAALQQCAQREHTATLFAHRDDDLVDAEVLHRFFQRQMIRDNVTRGDASCSNLLERIEPHQLQAWSVRHGERCFDHQRLGAGTEHQHAVGRKYPHKRRHHDLAHRDQANERDHHGRDERSLEHHAVRQDE